MHRTVPGCAGIYSTVRLSAPGTHALKVATRLPTHDPVFDAASEVRATQHRQSAILLSRGVDGDETAAEVGPQVASVPVLYQ
jgi:hypothetical protein